MSTLLERNRKVKEKAAWSSPESKEFRETMLRQHKTDVRDATKWPMGLDQNFSWDSFKKKIMKETNVSSANTQLLRAGVQTAVNNMYPAVPTTYDQWAHVIQSNKNTELYAPLNAMSFVEQVGEGERYAESNVVGLDIQLNNKKFGEVFPVTFELIDDDQTGQFGQKVSDMADYAAQLWEVWSYGKLASNAAGSTYGKLVVPASETKPSYESNYPYTTAASPFRGGGSNKPASFTVVTQAAVQAGFTALEEQLNLQGLKMAVKPDTIVVGPPSRWSLATLLNSNFYPSGAASAGGIGGALAINVLEGIAKPVISRFMFNNSGSSANSFAWYIMDTSKPWFVVQMREAAKITQENPETGAGFDRDIYRWKLSSRGNADFIDPRFVYQGNDGSVTS